MISAIEQGVLIFCGVIILLVLASMVKWRMHRRHITLRKHGRRKW